MVANEWRASSALSTRCSSPQADPTATSCDVALISMVARNTGVIIATRYSTAVWPAADGTRGNRRVGTCVEEHVDSERVEYLVKAAAGTFGLGTLFVFLMTLAASAAHLSPAWEITWVISAVAYCSAAAYLFGRPPRSVEPLETTHGDTPTAIPPPVEIVVRDDFEANEAFRAAMKQLNRLSAKHELAAKGGDELEHFAAGYKKAASDLAEPVVDSMAMGQRLGE